MIELEVLPSKKDKEKWVARLYGMDEDCPICGRKLLKHFWEWQVFHGEAKGSCGVIFQVKNYHIDNPSESERKLLDILGDSPFSDKIMLSVSYEWVEPIRNAMKELGKEEIDDEVIGLAGKSVKEHQ